MIIIYFKGKIIVLDYLQIGFAAYVSTIGVLWLIQYIRNNKGKKSRTVKFLKQLGEFRGGGLYLRQYLIKKFKKNAIFQVADWDLIQYILELTGQQNSTGVIYINLELLTYAMQTVNRVNFQNLIRRGFIIKVMKPVRTSLSVVIGTTLGKIMFVLTNWSSILGTIIIAILIYTSYISPVGQYNDTILVPVPTNDSIHYLMKDSQVPKIIVSIDISIPEIILFEPNGKLLNQNDYVMEQPNSIIVEHKQEKKMFKFNRKVHTINDPEFKAKVSVADFQECENDAEIVRQNTQTQREKVKIYSQTPKTGSE